MNSESDLDLELNHLNEDNDGGNYANYPWISKERGLQGQQQRSRRHSSKSGRLNESYKSC